MITLFIPSWKEEPCLATVTVTQRKPTGDVLDLSGTSLAFQFIAWTAFYPSVGPAHGGGEMCAPFWRMQMQTARF